MVGFTRAARRSGLAGLAVGLAATALLATGVASAKEPEANAKRKAAAKAVLVEIAAWVKANKCLPTIAGGKIECTARAADGTPGGLSIDGGAFYENVFPKFKATDPVSSSPYSQMNVVAPPDSPEAAQQALPPSTFTIRNGVGCNKAGSFFAPAKSRSSLAAVYRLEPETPLRYGCVSVP